MASVAWASFKHTTSSLWQKSMVALFVSNHSRPCSFSPVAEVAHLTGWLVHPWRGPKAMWQRQCPPPVVSLAGAVEKWLGQSWGCKLEWLPVETSAGGLPLGQGWQSPSSLAWGDLLILWLLAMAADLPRVLFWKAEAEVLRKPPAVTTWCLWAAGWWLQWCHWKVQQCLLEGVGLL